VTRFQRGAPVVGIVYPAITAFFLFLSLSLILFYMRVAQLISRYSRSFASLPAAAPSLFLSTSPARLLSPSCPHCFIPRCVRSFAPRAASDARKERELERQRERTTGGAGEYYSKQDLHFYDAAIFYQRHRPERIGIRFIYIYIYIYIYICVCVCVCICIYIYIHVHTPLVANRSRSGKGD